MKKQIIAYLCSVAISLGAMAADRDIFINVARMLINNDFRLSTMESELENVKSSSLLEQVMKIQPIIQKIHEIKVENATNKFISYDQGYLPLHVLISKLEIAVNSILAQWKTRDTIYRKNYTVPRDPIDIDFNLSDQFIKKENLADKEVIEPFDLPEFEIPKDQLMAISSSPSRENVSEIATKNFLKSKKLYESDDEIKESVSSTETVIIKHENSQPDSQQIDEPSLEELSHKRKTYTFLPWLGSRIGIPGIIAAFMFCMYANIKNGNMAFLRKIREKNRLKMVVPEPSYNQECSV